MLNDWNAGASWPCNTAATMNVSEVTVEMPADHGMKQLAGKQAIFSVTLKELKRRVLPELDDAFAKETSEFDTPVVLKSPITAAVMPRSWRRWITPPGRRLRNIASRPIGYVSQTICRIR